MICNIEASADVRGLREAGRGRPQSGRNLGAIFAANRQLFRGFDAHLDAPARSAQEGDLNGTVGEQLSHGHVGIGAIGRLNDYRFVGAAAED
jgi:hypothetical protein